MQVKGLQRIMNHQLKNIYQQNSSNNNNNNLNKKQNVNVIWLIGGIASQGSFDFQFLLLLILSSNI